MGELEVSLTLLDDLSSKDKRACLELLITIFGNVVKHPDDPKYRVLKTTNKKFLAGVWQHAGGQAIMEASGWEVRGETIQLPSIVTLDTQLQVLLSNRDVKPEESEWVADTKVVVPNAAKAREDELRRKALVDKEKQMAALKKEMAERKAIAGRIRAEHRMDQDLRRSQQPGVSGAARPLTTNTGTGPGGFRRMADMLPEDSGG